MDNSLWDTLHEDLQKKIIKIRDDELEYDDEDIIDSDDEETDDEIEEGEILSDSET